MLVANTISSLTDENRMFKKFDPESDLVGSQQLKSSVQKSIRAKLVETYPSIEQYQVSRKSVTMRIKIY